MRIIKEVLYLILGVVVILAVTKLVDSKDGSGILLFFLGCFYAEGLKVIYKKSRNENKKTDSERADNS